MEENKLNEAAKEYADTIAEDNIVKNLIIDDFIAGANWQNEQYPSLKWVKAIDEPDPGKTKWYMVRTNYHGGRCYCDNKFALQQYCEQNKLHFEDLEYLIEEPVSTTQEAECKGVVEMLNTPPQNLPNI